MTNSTKFAVALVVILAAITAVAAGGYKYYTSADSAALPFSAKAAEETPVRATKGDRLQVRHEIRGITGVTVVLRDFGRTIR